MMDIHLVQSPDQIAQESTLGGATTSLEQLCGMWFDSPVCSCVSLCMRQGETSERGASWMALGTESPKSPGTAAGCSQCVRLWGINRCTGLSGDVGLC